MNGQTEAKDSPSVIKRQIADIETKLQDAKSRLQAIIGGSIAPKFSLSSQSNNPATHHLLLLSDSALPLGSFAFSSGLESFLTHCRISNSSLTPTVAFTTFLPLSLSSYASLTLPYVLEAYRNPSRIHELDDLLDASTICNVARRASTSQGRALLGIWGKSYASHIPSSASEAIPALEAYSLVSKTRARADEFGISTHLPPLWGAICNALSIGLYDSAYAYLLAHVKALLSAAVRASVFGPYQAQRILMSPDIRRDIEGCVEREWATDIEEAGQRVPVLDLWMGRHELLYSRIFNS